MRGGVDTPPAKLLCVQVLHVVRVSLVKDTVGERRSGSDREEVTLQAGAVRVDVEECRSLL